MENTATYSPEDNKLRLYVGRVPREEYLKLRAEGWTSTPKQDCDFVATWTPQRRDTALHYAGVILDEDQSPEDRAADRAERFAGYRDKRTGEATARADAYDSAPQAFGYQSQARAERAAARVDRIASHACDAWDKAEYWQRRTAGVIGHALYVSSPSVRMGRIKTLEAELRQLESRYTPTDASEIMQENDKGETVAFAWCGQGRGGYWQEKSRLEAIKAGLADWINHLTLRIAYENQMLEAQGGRAAFVEMQVGGFIGGKQIHKVNKSPVTGRVVSVLVRDNHASNCNHYGNPFPDGVTKVLSHTIETERLPADAYRAPTVEELAAFEAARKARKAAEPKKEACPLVNPTDEDAERLQAILNERKRAAHCESHLRRYGKDYAEDFKPSTVCRIKQAAYSAASKGAYARAETRGLCKDAQLKARFSNLYNSERDKAEKAKGEPVCMIRVTDGDGSTYGANRVIVITDKSQKSLPREVWSVPAVEAAPEPQAPLGANPSAAAVIAEMVKQSELFAL